MLEDVSSITRMDDGANVIEKESVNLREITGNVVENERLRTDMNIHLDVPDIEISATATP